MLSEGLFYEVRGDASRMDEATWCFVVHRFGIRCLLVHVEARWIASGVSDGNKDERKCRAHLLFLARNRC